MVFIKKLKILHMFVFGKIGQENVFDDIQERKKKACPDYKKEEFKTRKNWDFSKISPRI